jgi:hypothetical protein
LALVRSYVCVNQRTIWSLCRAHTHGKAPTWRAPVQPGSWLVCCPRPLPCELAPGHTAKRQHRRTATKPARQRHDARQKGIAHSKGFTHGNGVGARQRLHARQSGNAHGNVSKAHQRPLPCVYGTAHDKDCVAVRDISVGTLPSVGARQRRYRVFLALCRASSTHGNACLSGSASTDVYFEIFVSIFHEVKDYGGPSI